jgi:hypothetical protein
MDCDTTARAQRRSLRLQVVTSERGRSLRYMITEFEPVFDAADFVRCGRDLFGIAVT